MSHPIHAARAAAMADDAARHFAETPSKLWTPPSPMAREAIGGDNLGLTYEDEELAFPNVPAPFTPLGSVVLVLLRQPPLQRTVGLRLDAGTRRTERDNTQVGKVVAIGPLAFRNRTTGDLWPEGAWCVVGDYVRVPKYQGDRMAVKYVTDEISIDEKTGKRTVDRVQDTVEFVGFNDLAITGRYPDVASALAVWAYL